MGIILRVLVSWCPLFCGNSVLKSAVDFVNCPESRSLSITTMVISIHNTDCVRCREVVRFSEGPLSEVRLHYDRQVFIGLLLKLLF